MRELIEELFAAATRQSAARHRRRRGAAAGTGRSGTDGDHRRLHRAAAGVSGRQHRFAGGSRHGQRSRGQRRGAALPDTQASSSKRVWRSRCCAASIDALAAAARDCGVAVVAGDTKVVGRGDCDGIYLATTGIGFRPRGTRYALDRIRAGDRILVSGPIGDHGTAVHAGARGVRSARGTALGCRQRAAADAGLGGVDGLRFMRDPTRGGLATVTHEIARATGLGVRLDEARIPVNESVQSVCELLGFDPLYLACEGRVVARGRCRRRGHGAGSCCGRWHPRPR